jgi:hypothetical protein
MESSLYLDTLKEGDRVTVKCLYSGGWLTGDSYVKKENGVLMICCQHGWMDIDFYKKNSNSFKINKINGR